MQMSILVGLPLVALLIKALPNRGGAQGSMDPLAGGYGVLMFVLGSVISWPQTQNSAMFSEVCQHPSPCFDVFSVGSCTVSGQI